MANHKSAEKRARQNIKKRERNLTLRALMRSTVKKALDGIKSAKNREEAQKALVAGERALHKAASKGVIPKQRASRKTARLAALVGTRFSA